MEGPGLGTAWEVTLQRVKTPIVFTVYTLTIPKGHLKQFLETKYCSGKFTPKGGAS